jgi:hypothetical protein
VQVTEAVGVEVLLAVGVADGDGVRVCVIVGVADIVAVGVGEIVGVAVTVAVAVAVGVAPAIPRPRSSTCCGLFFAESVSFNPFFFRTFPVAVGLNVTAS